MAHYQQHQAKSFWHNLGQKVHSGLEMANTAKDVWNMGKAIIGGIRIAAPYVGQVLSTAALL